MDSTIVVAIVVGLSGIVGAWFSARAATKAAMRKADSEERVAVQQIEAGAFGRAKEFYESTLSGMKTELTRQADRMQREIDQQAVQITTLQRQVARLSRQVRDAGLVPVTSGENEV